MNPFSIPDKDKSGHRKILIIPEERAFPLIIWSISKYVKMGK
jgi:hypothetical protein